MKASQEPTHTKCHNCSTPVDGKFCQRCGQRIRDNSDRSIVRLLGEVFGNIFFLDNRFFLSAWYIARYPGRMTIEFIEGKRKKFISPITLFLFINLIYFIVNPLSDYSLALYDQYYSQFYSEWTQEWVGDRLLKSGLEEENYSSAYQKVSDNISKSIMIINVPIIAIFVFLMAFKKRRFYFDSLIFSFHFFSLFMAFLVLSKWVSLIFNFASFDDDSANFDLIFVVFAPLFYAILSIKKLLNIKWTWSIPAGLGVMIAVLLANLIYRFIILILTMLFL